MNFQCGGCGNLMDVEDRLLGQPVRCPHCHQVVNTQVPLPSIPAPPQEPAAEIAVTVPPLHEQESIFAHHDHAGDDLFGDPAGARLDLPGAETPTQKTVDHPSGESILSPAPTSRDAAFGVAEMPRSEMSADRGMPPAPVSEIATSDGAPPSEVNLFQTPPSEASPAPGSGIPALAPASFPRSLPHRAVPAGMRGGLFIALVVIPLISYSILATIAVLILYFRPPQPSLEYLPDVEGDFPGAKKHKRASISYERLDPDSPLPERLKVGLNQSIQVGDVEVTPQRIELGRLRIRYPDQTVEIVPGEALILRLALKNISRDVLFSPNDPYFYRAWRSLQDSKPYTFLEVGDRRFYGGALPWHSGEGPDKRPALEGQEFRMLEPGQQLSTFVCTPADDSAGKVAGNYKGPLLWRVQVRRGLVQVDEREVPATTVIGVQFTAADIEKMQL